MIKNTICVLLCVILCFSFAACKKETSTAEKTFFVMDAALTVRLYGCTDEMATACFSQIFALVTDLENTLSRTVETSDISRINRERSAGDLSPHTVAVLTIAAEVSEATGGAYLPTTGALSDLWQKAGQENILPDPALLEAAAAEARKGFSLVDGVCTIQGEGALLDLGGIGKGYAVDLVCETLHALSVGGAIVSFGSSVAAIGEKGDGTPFIISLRDPKNTNGVFGKLISPAGILSVSGDYERYVTVGGVRYAHILDPASGYPAASGLSSVSVLTGDGTRADALSTAFLVMGVERSRAYIAAHPGIEAVFYTASGEVTFTEGLSGVFERFAD